MAQREEAFEISDSAFNNSDALTSFTVAGCTGGVTIGSEAFRNTSLNDIDLTKDIVAIGEDAFENAKLESVEFGSLLTTIGEGAFKGVTSLTDVTFPETGDVEVGESAFCSAVGESEEQTAPMISTLTLTTGIKSIGANAFSDCASINTIVVEGVRDEGNETTTTANSFPFKMRNWVESSTNNSGSSMLQKAYADEAGYSDSNVGTISNDGKFMKNESDLESNVTAYYEVFTITGLVHNASTYQTKLGNMNVKFVDQQDVNRGEVLTVAEGEDLGTFKMENVFCGTMSKATTSGGETTYSNGITTSDNTEEGKTPNATHYNTLTTIEEPITSDLTFDITNIEYVELEGTGKSGVWYAIEAEDGANVCYAKSTDADLSPETEIVGSVTSGDDVEEGAAVVYTVTKIGEGAFRQNSTLTKITRIADSVTKIEDNAFRMCQKLTSIELSKVEYVGQYAFTGSNLASVVLTSVTEVGDYAFYGCNYLARVQFTNTIVKIGNKAFLQSSTGNKLNYVVWASGNTEIGEHAFAMSTQDGGTTSYIDNNFWDYRKNASEEYEYVKVNQSGEEGQTVATTAGTYRLERNGFGGNGSGYYKSYSVSGVVHTNTSAKTPIQSATVQYTCYDDAGNEYTDFVSTDENGEYTFEGVYAGTGAYTSEEDADLMTASKANHKSQSFMLTKYTGEGVGVYGDLTGVDFGLSEYVTNDDYVVYILETEGEGEAATDVAKAVEFDPA